MPVEMTPDASGWAEKALWAGYTRRTAARAKAAERLAVAAETQADWWGICRRCGEKLEGSLAALKEHSCGTTD